MYLILKLKRLLLRHFSQFNGLTIFGVLLADVALTWGLLYLTGEKALLERGEFFYWLLVTASTVGYGDLSPQSMEGKWVVAFFVIPFGLGLFALIVGRLAAWSANQWKKGLFGMGTVKVNDHILVIGWNENRTKRLLSLLINDAAKNSGRKVVLTTVEPIQNPMVDEIDFVKVREYTSDEEMNRAGIASAATIVIDLERDDTTLTTALYCHKRNDKAHIIVYFQDESLSALLKSHCPNVESTPSVSIEMLAKSAMDPGSSVLHQELLDSDAGMTQYSLQLNEGFEARPFETLFIEFKHQHDAILLGLQKDGEGMALNPSLTTPVNPGDTLFYIAQQRIQGL